MKPAQYFSHADLLKLHQSTLAKKGNGVSNLPSSGFGISGLGPSGDGLEGLPPEGDAIVTKQGSSEDKGIKKILETLRPQIIPL